MRSGNDKPKRSIDSIASWWAGVKRGEDRFDITDLEKLFCNAKEPRVAFLTKPDRSLVVDTSRYPDSLPVAIAKAVMAQDGCQQRLRIIRTALSLDFMIVANILTNIGGASWEDEGKNIKRLRLVKDE